MSNMTMMPVGFYGSLNMNGVAGPETVTDAPADGGGLTPGALMVYCETRLHHLDTQMQSYFDQETNNYAAQQALANVTAALNNVASNGYADGASCSRDILSTIQDAIDKVGPDSSTGQQLIHLRDQIAMRAGGDGLVAKLDADPGGTMAAIRSSSGDQDFCQKLGVPSMNTSDDSRVHDPNGSVKGTDVQGWVNEVKDMTSDLSNASQMGMIQLQSLMSDRQTALQLCTNLIQSLGDQTNKIAANVGH